VDRFLDAGAGVEEAVHPVGLVVAEVEPEGHVQRLALVEVAVVPDGVARVVERALYVRHPVLVHPALGVRDGAA